MAIRFDLIRQKINIKRHSFRHHAVTNEMPGQPTPSRFMNGRRLNGEQAHPKPAESVDCPPLEPKGIGAHDPHHGAGDTALSMQLLPLPAQCADGRLRASWLGGWL